MGCLMSVPTQVLYLNFIPVTVCGNSLLFFIAISILCKTVTYCAHPFCVIRVLDCLQFSATMNKVLVTFSPASSGGICVSVSVLHFQLWPSRDTG